MSFLLLILSLLASAPSDGARPTAPAVSASDTLRVRVPAGEPVMLALPRAVRGENVSYQLLRAPALSWLQDSSYLWRTQPGERGRVHVLMLRASAGAPADTLVLEVDVHGWDDDEE
jgi:hypothetical protein